MVGLGFGCLEPEGPTYPPQVPHGTNTGRGRRGEGPHHTATVGVQRERDSLVVVVADGVLLPSEGVDCWLLQSCQWHTVRTGRPVRPMDFFLLPVPFGSYMVWIHEPTIDCRSDRSGPAGDIRKPDFIRKPGKNYCPTDESASPGTPPEPNPTNHSPRTPPFGSLITDRKRSSHGASVLFFCGCSSSPRVRYCGCRSREFGRNSHYWSVHSCQLERWVAPLPRSDGGHPRSGSPNGD